MKKTNIFILILLLALMPSNSFGQLSATDSVIVSNTSPGSFTNAGRGFRFTPNANINLSALGKRVAAAQGNYTWVIWNTVSQTIVYQQVSTSNTVGVYTYEPISSPVQLMSGVSYDLMLYCDNTPGATYYFGSSTQVNTSLTYGTVLFCNSCGPATYPTGVIANFHYGTPDFHFTLTPCLATSSSFSTTTCVSYTVPSGDETYNVLGTQTVQDTIMNSCGGDSLMSITVTILPALTGVITDVICADDIILVNGNTYDVNNLTGTEVFTNIGPNGCDSTVTINLTIAAVDTSTNIFNNIITSNASGASYEWIDCSTGLGVVPSQNGQSFITTSNGNYAVVVTVGNCIDTSACINVSTVGIDNLKTEVENISLFPNPTTEDVIVNLGTLSNVVVTVVNITGEEVYHSITNNKNKTKISLEGFGKGIYFVKIQGDNQQKVIKLIKQ